MKQFQGIEVFKAIALYSGLKIYRGIFGDKAKSNPIDSSQAIELISTAPDSVWAEVSEAGIEEAENDPTGSLCPECGMTYIPPLTQEEVSNTLRIREELLKYSENSNYKLDPEIALQASMLIGNYELFHRKNYI